MAARTLRSQIPRWPLDPTEDTMLSAPQNSSSSRPHTPSASPNVKRYKAQLSTESKTRSRTKSTTSNSELPRTPTRSRSNTPIPPGSPRTPARSQSRCENIFMESEMDVSRIDPEQALIDAENVEVDLSAELDERELRSLLCGNEDKVHVSLRVRPSDQPHAWTVNHEDRSIKLNPQHHKSSATPVPEYTYDNILTGSKNKPVYNSAAWSHVNAAMDGYNAVVFAYGQTASGKTFTLTGTDEEPGIIPRAMKDVFAYIRRTPSREYLLRCSYLEIYNEAIFDLLAPPSARSSNTVQIQGVGDNVFLSPLREEVVTSLKGVRDVLERGYGNRRTASTDWNERSSRSHSVFRLVIESRERGPSLPNEDGRATPIIPPTPGGTRLQSRGGRSVQTSVLSLIDLAGSERATSDKDRTREGRYINTSLLTLGSVIGTLAENAAKKKNDHVPFRNSKLTRMLQPSLSGNARISVICTINPEPSAVAESTSTLLFAQRVKRVQLNAKKKEVVDTEALLERYRKEIEDLKQRLAEREAAAPVIKRRLSAKEQLDESRAMNDLNSRIKQLTKLILTSQSVDENKGDQSRPASPTKLDFDLEPYQLQQELLKARRQIESQATQILSLEAALSARPQLPADAPETEKDKLIAEQMKNIRELEFVVRGYEENLGAPLRAVKEDVEREWIAKVEAERKLREEKEAWAEELILQLEKEKSLRQRLEIERKALATFVTRFDSLGLASAPAIPSRLRQPALPSTIRRHRSYSTDLGPVAEVDSPIRRSVSDQSPMSSPMKTEFTQSVDEDPSLLKENDEGDFPELSDIEGLIDLSFENNLESDTGRKEESILLPLHIDSGIMQVTVDKVKLSAAGRSILKDKENIAPSS